MSSNQLFSGALPVQLFMPPDGISFDPTAYIALPAIGVTSTVVSFTVPDGYHGIIKRLGNVYVGTGFIEGSGALVWQLLSNAGVIRNYDNILASLGLVSNPKDLGGGIFVHEGELVVLQVNNVSLAVGGATVGGRLSGWFFPKWRMPDEASIF
jgi:hypothetical protein